MFCSLDFILKVLTKFDNTIQNQVKRFDKKYNEIYIYTLKRKVNIRLIYLYTVKSISIDFHLTIIAGGNWWSGKICR